MRRLTRLRPRAAGLLAPVPKMRCIAAGSFHTNAPRQNTEQPLAAHPEDHFDVPTSTATGLPLPPITHWAPAADKVEDPAYQPAVSIDGLEEVGGLEGWWEDDARWSEVRPAFSPFFPGRERVWDSGMLLAAARRAVVEALAVREATGTEGAPRLAGLWRDGGREAAARALGVGIEVAENGEGRLTSGSARDQILGDLVAVEGEEGETPQAIDAAEVGEIVKTFEADWTGLSLADPAFKFAVTKRIQQLTGQMLPDAKMKGVSNVDSMLRLLLMPPRPERLAEELRGNDELQKLANVTVHHRRQTPIDKDKAVGRWKVIVRELEKRDLPVTGHGKYGRPVEKSWVRGGV